MRGICLLKISTNQGMSTTMHFKANININIDISFYRTWNGAFFVRYSVSRQVHNQCQERVLHTVWSGSSSFILHYLFLSSMSFSSCVRFLPLLLVPSNFPSFFHSIIYFNTFTAIVDLSRFNNSCLKSPASTLVDLTLQSRALRSFSLNQLRNLSL